MRALRLVVGTGALLLLALIHNIPAAGGIPFAPKPIEHVVLTDPPTTKQTVALIILRELGAIPTPHAVAFLVAWQYVENCAGNNPFCRLDEHRQPYRYRSTESGAKSMAKQIDPHHPARPPEWNASYPLITDTLRASWRYQTASQLADAAATELRKWCGPPGVCAPLGDTDYVEKIRWRLDSRYDK